MTGPSTQIPIDLAGPPSFEAADFVPTPANETAARFLDLWPDWGNVGAILVGPAGAGKSHLATMLAARIDGATLLPLCDLTEDHLQTHGNAALLVLDHEDGKPFDETALFHLINHFRQADRPTARLLILARNAPQEWGATLPDVLSRLAAFDLVRIDQPDDFSLEVLLQKLFADRQVTIDPAVIAYMLRRMPRSYHAAREIVARMDRIGLARKSKLSRTVAAAALDELEAAQ